MEQKTVELGKDVIIVECENHSDVCKLSNMLDLCGNQNGLDISIVTKNKTKHRLSNKRSESDALIINSDYVVYPENYPIYIALYKNGETTILVGDYSDNSISVSEFIIDVYYWSEIDYPGGGRIFEIPFDFYYKKGMGN